MVKARKAQHYINVMEMMVAEEVDKHLQRLPDRIVQYIKRSEVETFALNQLPALYASSEKGLRYQRERALEELQPQIINAVRQAFAAVQVDPIRLSEPLQLDDGFRQAEAVLKVLKQCLKTPDLTWETALGKLEKLQQRQQKSSRSPQHSISLPSQQRAVSSPAASRSSQPVARRPGTYGASVNWKPRQRASESSEGFEGCYLR